MPEKYHIATQPVPPRRPRVGKYGIVDWREDCCRCHNCVKKSCIYDRHRDEMKYLRDLNEVDAVFFDCMGCLWCVQNCTKNLLCLSVNPTYEKLGNSTWTPEIIRTTWLQAETAKIPVSGAGYRGKFAGPGFDSMWTDMSEIVRPTRDGIHGREYINTSVDIGRKPSRLNFEGGSLQEELPTQAVLPMPLLIDMMPEEYSLPVLEPFLAATSQKTGLIALIDYRKWDKFSSELTPYLNNLAFYLPADGPLPAAELLKQTRLVEIEDGGNIDERIKQLKEINPAIVAVVRVVLDQQGVARAIELGKAGYEAVHIVADLNGREIGVEDGLYTKDMIRKVHTALIEQGGRDETTLIAGGGIALPEHMAKGLLCGADAVSINLPLMIGMECHLCKTCKPGGYCPAKLETVEKEYAVGRMTNLIAAWHGQLIEVMGAMGIREARRLRGEVGRALFYEELEEESFGQLFGKRKNA